MDDYSILGASRTDPIDIITKKYKKLAKKYHPDRKRNINNKIVAEEKFKEISSAYHNIINNNTKPFGTFTPNMNGQFNFTHIFSKINNMKDFLKNMDYEHLINNVIDKVDTFSDFIDSKKTNLEYTEDLYINANIELFDIYNNIEKKIHIERFRKCDECKGVLEHCSKCNSMKYINKNIELLFECKLKNIVFYKLSHHYNNKTPGNIIININPKVNSHYNIYNNYDLIYTMDCKDNINSNEYDFCIKHLDNKTYSFKIQNPQLNTKYKIPNLGLLFNSDKYRRGDLYIILISQNKKDTEIKML